MLPALAVVPFEEDFVRPRRGINEHIGEQRFALLNVEAGRVVLEPVAVRPDDRRLRVDCLLALFLPIPDAAHRSGWDAGRGASSNQTRGVCFSGGTGRTAGLSRWISPSWIRPSAWRITSIAPPSGPMISDASRGVGCASGTPM